MSRDGTAGNHGRAGNVKPLVGLSAHTERRDPPFAMRDLTGELRECTHNPVAAECTFFPVVTDLVQRSASVSKFPWKKP